jgi:hypothetical protein
MGGFPDLHFFQFVTYCTFSIKKILIGNTYFSDSVCIDVWWVCDFSKRCRWPEAAVPDKGPHHCRQDGAHPKPGAA